MQYCRTLCIHYWWYFKLLISLIVHINLHLLIEFSFYLERSLYTGSIIFPDVVIHADFGSNIWLSINHRYHNKSSNKYIGNNHFVADTIHNHSYLQSNKHEILCSNKNFLSMVQNTTK